jgi:hypothetical protein
MPSLLKRFRRARGPEQENGAETPVAAEEGEPGLAPDGAPAAPAAEAAPPPRPRRRTLPPAGALRRERRVLLRNREDRVRDLGGLVLEMYRQDRFRQDLVYEQAAEVVAIEERLFQVDQLLALAASRGRVAPAQQCPQCGSPVLPGARFCASCGNALATFDR